MTQTAARYRFAARPGFHRADFLVPVHEITLDHQAFHKSPDFLRYMHAVEDILGNADLLHISFTGVIVIAVNNDCRI